MTLTQMKRLCERLEGVLRAGGFDNVAIITHPDDKGTTPELVFATEIDGENVDVALKVEPV